jgi:D-alanyl-D-alanine carboxypeptidase/D-alanyl-D-alanine-endopeptidase (penicillin-binding protein 4)
MSPYPAIKYKLDSILPDTLFPPSNVGIKIVSLTKNETLYELNPDALFNPASNQKLFTGATALATLGEGFLLSTIVGVDTASRTIFVKGCGDPLLATSDIDSLARIVAPLLPPRESWTLVCDVSYFDDLYWGAGWTWDEEPAAYGMFISPLILNNNTIEVKVWPGTKAGDRAVVTTSPSTDYVTIQNGGSTVADTVVHPIEISRKWLERSNIITVGGEIKLNSSNADASLSVWDPSRYAITVLAERLKELGVRITNVSIDTSSASRTEIARYSHRLDSAVTFMNKVSDNLSAEALLKTVASEKRGTPGSAAAGITVLKEFLGSIAVDTNRIAIADGSGLSRYNLTSASTVVRLLQAVYNDGRHFDALLHSLPIAGVDGTISGRMKGTAAEGNLRAKTGTLSAVTALSGFVRTKDGEMLAFSILMQNFASSSRAYRQVQDGIGVFLSEMSRSQF